MNSRKLASRRRRVESRGAAWPPPPAPPPAYKSAEEILAEIRADPVRRAQHERLQERMNLIGSVFGWIAGSLLAGWWRD